MRPELVTAASTALIVIDVQNDFLHPQGVFGKAGRDLTVPRAILPRLARLIDVGRVAGARVVFIRAVQFPWGDSDAWTDRHDANAPKPPAVCLSQTWGAEFVDEIVPRPDEPVLIKPRYSAFFGTPLDTLLRSAGVKTVVVSGVTSNVCVESTARDAHQLDYHVVLATDCIAAFSAAEHDSAVHNVGRYFGRVANSDDLGAIWRGAAELGRAVRVRADARAL